MRLSIHIDGGARGNPGPAAAGIVILDADTGRALRELGVFLGQATNNVAEYQGLIRSLKVAIGLGATELTIHSDSELMVRQIHGQYRVKSPELRPLFQEAMGLLRQAGRWTLTHVRREKNQRADQLVNAALDAGMDIDYTS
jgi:ribonuclease HI